MGLTLRALRELLRILGTGVLPSDGSAASDLYYAVQEAIDSRSIIEQRTAESDRLRAERDAAQAEAAGLREALEEIKSEASVDISELDGNEGTCICCFCGGSWDSSMQPDHKQECPASTAATALARTPAQHRDRIVAAGLREAAERLRKQDCSDEAARTYEWLIAEAERLEKEAGNGTL